MEQTIICLGSTISKTKVANNKHYVCSGSPPNCPRSSNASCRTKIHLIVKLVLIQNWRGIADVLMNSHTAAICLSFTVHIQNVHAECVANFNQKVDPPTTVPILMGNAQIPTPVVQVRIKKLNSFFGIQRVGHLRHGSPAAKRQTDSSAAPDQTLHPSNPRCPADWGK